MACILLVGMAADELSGAEKALNPPAGAKVLHFPADRSLGKMFVEDESDGWNFFGPAQGDVVVPADRNIKLQIHFREPRPNDLSGLSKLGPSDLHELSLQSSIRRSSANRPRLESISHLTGLQILSLGNTGVTGRQMSSLKSLSSLRALELHQERSLGSDGLAVLKDLPALEYLDYDTVATDTGLKHLGQLPNLRWLRLRMGRIRGPGLAYLANLPRPERLSLCGEGISDRHVSYLEGLARLKSLTLWGGTKAPLTDATLASISKLTALEELHFIRIETNFTDTGIAHLKGLKNLEKIGFSYSNISDVGVRHLAAIPHLESISGVRLASAGLKALASCRNLKCLGTNLLWVGDRWGGSPMDVAHLAALNRLEELGIGGRDLSDADLAHLESLNRLKHLSVFTKDITERGWASIGKLKQLEYLSVHGQVKKNHVTKRGLNHLNGLTNLQTLNLSMSSGPTPVMDNTPLNLTALTNLKTIELIGLSLQESDLEFLAGLDHLEWLKLQNYGVLSENALKYIKDLPKLKRLHIIGLTCTDSNGLVHLGGLKRLKFMTLDGRITDSAIGRMTGLPSLQWLNVTTDVTIWSETVARLKQILPAIRSVDVKQPQ